MRKKAFAAIGNSIVKQTWAAVTRLLANTESCAVVTLCNPSKPMDKMAFGCTAKLFHTYDTLS